MIVVSKEKLGKILQKISYCLWMIFVLNLFVAFGSLIIAYATKMDVFGKITQWSFFGEYIILVISIVGSFFKDFGKPPQQSRSKRVPRKEPKEPSQLEKVVTRFVVAIFVIFILSISATIGASSLVFLSQQFGWFKDVVDVIGLGTFQWILNWSFVVAVITFFVDLIILMFAVIHSEKKEEEK